MSFGQEIRDFTKSFSTGYEMARSPDERRADELANEINTEKLSGLQYLNTEEYRDRQKRLEESLLTSRESENAYRDVLRSEKEYDMSPSRRAAREAAEETERAAKEATTSLTKATTTGKELENEIAKLQSEVDKSVLEEYLKLKRGLENPGSEPLSAVPDDSAPTSAPDDGASNYLPDDSMLAGTPAQQAISENFGEPEGKGVPVDEAPAPDEEQPRKPKPKPQTIEEGKPVQDTFHDAVRDGANYYVQSSGLGQDTGVDTPETEKNQQAFLTDENAPPVADVKAAEDIADKWAGGGLSQDQRMMYALAFGYDAYMSTGQTEKAQRYAAGLLSHYHKMFSQYTAVAQAALEKGDLPQAVEAAARAYANVPDGYNAEFTIKDKNKIQATITDSKTGKTVTKTLLSPDEFGGLVMKVNPTDFYKLIANAAGKREEGLSQAFVKRNPAYAGFASVEEASLDQRIRGEDASMEDSNTAITAIDEATGRFEEANPEAALQLEDKVPGYKQDLSPAAESIFKLNPGLGPDRAYRGAVNLMSAPPPEGGIVELPDGTVEVHLEGIAPFKMPAAEYATLTLLRRKFMGPPTAAAPAGAPAVPPPAAAPSAVPVQSGQRWGSGPAPMVLPDLSGSSPYPLQQEAVPTGVPSRAAMPRPPMEQPLDRIERQKQGLR